MRSWLLERYALGKLSAADVCTCAYACRSCPELGISDLAVPPLASCSGNYERQMSSALKSPEFQERQLFWSNVPTQVKKQGRRLRPHPFLLPHETIHETAGWNINSLVPGW